MQKKSGKKTGLIAVCGAMVFSALIYTAAMAGIMVMPVTVIFGERDRVKGITVVNRSNDQGTFKMALFYQRQVPEGGYIRQDTPTTPVDIIKYVSFSPRLVTLDPQGKQSVRMSLKRPADLPDGEYRFHMKVQQDNSGQVRLGTKAPDGKKGQDVMLQMSAGFAIPVIIRHGKYDADASIEDLRFVPSPDGKKPSVVAMTLKRSGKFSTLGNVIVYWTPPGGGEEKLAGFTNNVNIFPEITERSIAIGLTEKNIAGGTFRVVYEGALADKGITFDEKTLNP